ncbi:PIN domain-containing protein [Xenorhabdus sp. KJ12.1]|uniref:PIN domain-containing protein n=1 Tax=Xenorhabdus sp. KJ12.1 TaxID=1851571 RepID=UPI000C03CF9C|nr:PIN domain-containing protein [Xenorhabdus sp. KJ12.1]PHM72344.1 hypothetical protein Xekj_00623 [Xenorhabdus sp. KJ12.1]
MSNNSLSRSRIYVMVDYENVQPSINSFTKQPETYFIIFLGHQQVRVNFNLASILQPLGSRAEYVKINGTGANALDFHIVLFVGKITERDPSATFVIISNDKGYDPVIDYLNRNGTKIKRQCVSERCKSHSSQFSVKKRINKREKHIKRIIRVLKVMPEHALKDRTALERLVRTTSAGESVISNKEVKRVIHQLTTLGLVNTQGKRFICHTGNTKI